ncbi:hypothetical protein FHS76_004249 [Ochrobactrum daejeonense]|uniref:Uncharacterized protein n=1 Tax=Brucella daejeonensis TaxID=659015 RepID=A0A7W9B1D3_9HYPH|nr:hypothetical protein [Brucella daejeonensis]MBB5704332.1 hypothetical protein [Brucella daejeonensis]
MSKIETGGPAFPVSVPVDFQFAHEGMTLRDYFAAIALQGMLTNGFMPKEVTIEVMSSYAYEDQEQYKKDCAQNHYSALAYRMADAMLAARGGDRD